MIYQPNRKMKVLIASFAFSSLCLTPCRSEMNFEEPVDADLEITHYSETVETPALTKAEVPRYLRCLPHLRMWAEPAITDPTIAIGLIVNAARLVWDVIVQNQPTATARTSYANAIPDKAAPFDITGFSEPQFTSHRVYGKNRFGVTVYDLTYTLAHRYGGSYSGAGKFLENVTVLPRKIYSAFGYRVDMSVSEAQAVNLGTTEAPIAGLMLDIQVSISTMLQASLVTKAYEFRGDSAKVKVLKLPEAEPEAEED